MEKLEIDKYLTQKENDVFLILTGLGGNTKGYENKYETISKNASVAHGFNVFVVGTPYGVYDNSKEFFDIIFSEIDKELERKDYSVYLMGHSAGGTVALWNLNKYPNIKRMVAINPVLNINLHKVEASAKQLEGKFIKIIIGDKDSSYKFSPLLNKINNIQVEILKDTDHEFKDKLQEFIDLSNKYLFI